MLFSAHPNIHYRTFLLNGKFQRNSLLSKRALPARGAHSKVPGLPQKCRNPDPFYKNA